MQIFGIYLEGIFMSSERKSIFKWLGKLSERGGTMWFTLPTEISLAEFNKMVKSGVKSNMAHQIKQGNVPPDFKPPRELKLYLKEIIEKRVSESIAQSTILYMREREISSVDFEETVSRMVNSALSEHIKLNNLPADWEPTDEQMAQFREIEKSRLLKSLGYKNVKVINLS
jgi:hypothetical protein